MKSFIKGIFAVTGAIVIFIILVGIFSSSDKTVQSHDTLEDIQKGWDSLEANQARSERNPTNNIPVISNWDYSENTDGMDSKKSFFAVCTSPTIINFGFPYEGGSTFNLTIQNKRGENGIYLSVSKGQFLTDIENEKRIRIKFDSEKPFYINCGGTSDGSSTDIFLYPETKIISKIKTAKSITIEPEFYQEGFRQIDFNVSGLNWRH